MLVPGQHGVCSVGFSGCCPSRLISGARVEAAVFTAQQAGSLEGHTAFFQRTGLQIAQSLFPQSFSQNSVLPSHVIAEQVGKCRVLEFPLLRKPNRHRASQLAAPDICTVVAVREAYPPLSKSHSSHGSLHLDHGKSILAPSPEAASCD